MIKKSIVRINCPVCHKTTYQEISEVDGQQKCVCLNCVESHISAEQAWLKDQNCYERQKYETERELEAQRMRNNSPGG